jgi:hypothetical protein
MSPDRKLVLDALTALELEAKGYADRTRRLQPVIHALRKRLNEPDLVAEDLRQLRNANAQLLEGLQQIIDLPEDSRIHYKVARRAIATAKGQI